MDTILVYGKNDFENDLEGDFRIETNNLYFAEMLGKCCYNVSKLCDHFVKRSDKTLSLSLSLSLSLHFGKLGNSSRGITKEFHHPCDNGSKCG